MRCPPGDARPYKVHDDHGAPAAFVRVASTTHKAEGGLHRQLQEVSARTPFDERVHAALTVHDLSLSLLLSHLTETGSRLIDGAPHTAELFERLDLARRVNGHVAPRNVALRYFTPRPSAWFPGARIEISVHGAPEAAIERLGVQDGPLPDQIRGALRALAPFMKSRTQKVPGHPEADVVHASPLDAVEEAISNAVYHRGYEDPNPTRVEVRQDALKITSYPGPIPGLSREHLAADVPPAVPTATVVSATSCASSSGWRPRARGSATCGARWTTTDPAARLPVRRRAHLV